LSSIGYIGNSFQVIFWYSQNMNEHNKEIERVVEPDEMKAEDVIGLIEGLKNHSIEIWLDGGWGVDALLGEQTRPHDDVDITIESNHVPKLRELLTVKGYKNVERDDTSDWNFVLGDSRGHKVDVHVLTLDENGNGLYGPSVNKKETQPDYPAESLTGTGSINSYPVKCISPECMVKFHTGYEVDENDFKDVYALHKKFGIAIPEAYDKWVDTKAIES
jgi:lincosamide nucleotidyltransferase A/C/D/E